MIMNTMSMGIIIIIIHIDNTIIITSIIYINMGILITFDIVMIMIIMIVNHYYDYYYLY